MILELWLQFCIQFANHPTL